MGEGEAIISTLLPLLDLIFFWGWVIIMSICSKRLCELLRLVEGVDLWGGDTLEIGVAATMDRLSSPSKKSSYLVDRLMNEGTGEVIPAKRTTKR